MISGLRIGGMPRVLDPDCVQVYTKEICYFLHRKSGAVYVPFIVL